MLLGFIPSTKQLRSNFPWIRGKSFYQQIDTMEKRCSEILSGIMQTHFYWKRTSKTAWWETGTLRDMSMVNYYPLYSCIWLFCSNSDNSVHVYMLKDNSIFLKSFTPPPQPPWKLVCAGEIRVAELRSSKSKIITYLRSWEGQNALLGNKNIDIMKTHTLIHTDTNTHIHTHTQNKIYLWWNLLKYSVLSFK